MSIVSVYLCLATATVRSQSCYSSPAKFRLFSLCCIFRHLACLWIILLLCFIWTLFDPRLNYCLWFRLPLWITLFGHCSPEIDHVCLLDCSFVLHMICLFVSVRLFLFCNHIVKLSSVTFSIVLRLNNIVLLFYLHIYILHI